MKDLWIDVIKKLLLDAIIVMALGSFLEVVLFQVKSTRNEVKQLLSAVFFTLMGFASIAFPLIPVPGIRFDFRFVIILLAAYYGGFFSGGITAALLLIFRIILGGDGMWVGLGSILTSLIIGVVFHYIPVRRRALKYLLMLGMGFLLSLSLLFWITYLGESHELFNEFLIPILLTFPLFTLVLGIVMNEIRLRRYRTGSPSYYKTLMENIPDGIFFKDKDLKYISCNDAFAEMIGVSVDRIVGFQDRDLFPGELVDHFEILDNEVFNSGKSLSEEHSLEDGENQRFFNIIRTPVFDNFGNVTALLGRLDEITELKKLHWDLYSENTQLQEGIRRKTEALLQSEARFREAFNSSGFGMSIIDDSFVIQDCNLALEKMLGYSARDLMGLSLLTLMDERDRDDDELQLEFLKRGEVASLNLERRFRAKEGRIFWGAVNITEVKSVNLEKSQFLIQIIDVDRQKKDKIALSSALGISRLIEDKTLQEIINQTLKEAENISESQISYFHFVNPDQNSIQLNSWSESTLESCSVPDPESHYPVSSAGIWTECIKEKKPVYHNDYPSCKNKKGLPKGHIPLRRDLAIPLFDNDRIVAILGLGNKSSPYNEDDISRVSLLAKYGWLMIHRKQIEVQLEQAKEQAETASRIKSEFLSNMSHELRTPLNAVIGFSDLLTSKLEDPEQQFFTESITEAGNALLDLINDILDLSKMESGKLDILPKEIHLHRLLEKVLSIFMVEAENKGLQLELNLDSELPDLFYLDETRLRQVLLNLIGNALKFTAEGKIILSAEYRGEEQTLLFSVQDTGMGIPETELDRIFKTFEQQQGQDASLYGGSGLGLAISRRLIHLMKGDIKVSSRVGEGSCFTIELYDLQPLEDQEKDGRVGSPESDEGISLSNNYKRHNIVPMDTLKNELKKLSSQDLEAFRKYFSEQVINVQSGLDLSALEENTEKIIILLSASDASVLYDQFKKFAYVIQELDLPRIHQFQKIMGEVLSIYER